MKRIVAGTKAARQVMAKHQKVQTHTVLSQEVLDHNAEVERKKEEKRLRKALQAAIEPEGGCGCC